jgi:hypothetical protein
MFGSPGAIDIHERSAARNGSIVLRRVAVGAHPRIAGGGTVFEVPEEAPVEAAAAPAG